MRYLAIIVGAGPAGIAAALHLHKQRPELCRRVLVIEKKKHPRKKLCGGGVNAKALPVLREMGVDLLQEGPQRLVAAGYDVRFEEKRRVFDEPGGTLVFDRAALDDFLCRTAKNAGIEIREEEAVEGIDFGKSAVRVRTAKAEYEADCVVGADGVGSLVRRAAKIPETYPRGRLLQAEVPLRDPSARHLVFDFSCITDGIAGYAWLFPEPTSRGPVAKVGIYDRTARPSRRRNPRPILEKIAKRWGYEIPRDSLEAYSIREWTPRARLSAPRTILVGDAAGADPLVAEGLHQAFAYGEIAAAAVSRAADFGDFSFRHYTRLVRESDLGAELRRNRMAATLLYGPFYRAALGLGFRYPGALERAFAYVAGRAPELGGMTPWGVVARAAFHIAKQKGGD